MRVSYKITKVEEDFAPTYGLIVGGVLEAILINKETARQIIVNVFQNKGQIVEIDWVYND